MLTLLAALAVGSPAAAPASGSSTSAFPAAGIIVGNRLSVRARPSLQAAVLKRMPQFRRDFRRTVVLAVAADVVAGRRWLRVEIPSRPNGRTGWVPATAVQVSSTHRLIVIDRSQRRLTVYVDGKPRYVTKVAVGRPGMETPLGHFYVAAGFRPTESFLGVYAFETSAYSKLSEWPGGGIVAIHGWNDTSVLGKAVSHGCVRVSNTGMHALSLIVPIGTPITIKN
ncbi:MAG: L,D-transpeptidase [Gaiellaceae bacterium]